MCDSIKGTFYPFVLLLSIPFPVHIIGRFEKAPELNTPKAATAHVKSILKYTDCLRIKKKNGLSVIASFRKAKHGVPNSTGTFYPVMGRDAPFAMVRETRRH